MSLRPNRANCRPYLERLLPAYLDYIENVSNPAHALSVETSALIWWTCDQINARQVCDLGSGFSSFVLHAYALTSGATVTSVDTDPEWLDKTRAFLADVEAPTDGLIMLDDWLISDDKYDLILNDLAGGDLRSSTYGETLDRLHPGGVAIMDDAQSSSHRTAMCVAAGERDLAMVDVWGATLDPIGRFAVMVTT